MRKKLAILCLWLCGAVVGIQAQTPTVGMNLSEVVDWGTNFPFLDLFKTAREWIPQRQGADWGQGGTLALTPEGWVASLETGQYAETLLFSADPALLKAFDGEYVILYEGEGEIAFRGSNVTIKSQSSGRIVVDALPSQSPVFLQIVQTNPANPLREIRFVSSAFEATFAQQVFTPIFLERLGGFGVLRFMDWMHTNNSTLRTWADRPLVTDAVYSIKGVPLELIVRLANTLQADAWLNIPHDADEDFIRKMAVLVRDTLSPDLKVYLEYSNETWNGQFLQAFYVSEEGGRLQLAGNDRFWGGLRYHAQRAVAAFTIWEEVFGGTDRLVRVLASQAANNWTGEQIAEWQDAYQHADALAIAPYFSCDDPANPDNVAGVLAAGVEALVEQQVRNVSAGGCALDYIQANLDITKRFGLSLIAYEGGQHLAGYGGTENNEALTDLFIAANRHPRMGEAYTRFLEAWYTAGAGVFVAFADAATPSRFGSWGVLEVITQDPATAPKYQALRAFITR